MNTVYLRLRDLPEMRANASVNLTVSELFPKLIQQYGHISYHYHRELFAVWTPEIYSRMTQVGETFANATTGWFPGSAANTAALLASEPP